MQEVYYQVQYQGSNGKAWEPLGEAQETRLEANQVFLDLVCETYNLGWKVYAARIVSVVKHWDGVWRVKEVLMFKEFPSA